MDTILLGLAAASTTILVAPLAIISAGIHRQERAGSITDRRIGSAAALARKVLALHTTPLTGSQLSTPITAPSLTSARRPAVRPAPFASEVRS
jgi:hypothetical protein